MKEIDIELLAAKYAYKYSNPPEFTVGTGVDYDEYLKLSKELRQQLFENFKEVFRYVFNDYVLFSRERLLEIYEFLKEAVKEEYSNDSELISKYKAQKEFLDNLFREDIFDSLDKKYECKNKIQ